MITKRPAFEGIPNPPPTEVTYGCPYIEACTSYINSTLHASNVYILASNSMSKQTDYVQKLEQALGSAWAGTSTGIRAHTYLSDLLPITREVLDKHVDCIVTMGGSSQADGSQIIAYAAANDIVPSADESEDETLTSLLKLKVRRGGEQPPSHAPTIPLIFIPTSLSGGEYSQYGGGTDPRTQEKVIFAHWEMYPRLIILDPAVTSSTPEWVWLSTGVRAIDHCVENICSTNAKPAATAAAKEALAMLVPGLLASKRDLRDLDAKLECMLGCNLAMTGLIMHVWCGASHGIGHQLGPMGVGHGQTSCILLPAVCKFNARVNGAVQESVKDMLWEQNEVAEILEMRGLQRRGSDLGDALDCIFTHLGMPRSLNEVGVGRDKFAVVADNSTRDHFCLENPVPLDKLEDVMQILEMVVG